MPLYEYECQQCKRHTEKIQKFSDTEITECPHCGGPLERVISAAAISFKGGGWFKDGYGNAKPSASNSESKSDSSVPSVEAAAASNSKDSAPAASAPASPSPAPAPAVSSSDKK
jgi:putative FmdB family regulatory protein